MAAAGRSRVAARSSSRRDPTARWSSPRRRRGPARSASRPRSTRPGWSIASSRAILLGLAIASIWRSSRCGGRATAREPAARGALDLFVDAPALALSLERIGVRDNAVAARLHGLLQRPTVREEALAMRLRAGIAGDRRACGARRQRRCAPWPAACSTALVDRVEADGPGPGVAAWLGTARGAGGRPAGSGRHARRTAGGGARRSVAGRADPGRMGRAALPRRSRGRDAGPDRARARGAGTPVGERGARPIPRRWPMR